MKKTIKLSFAALAMTALASCSGDDLLGNGNNPLKQNNKRTVTVEVEDMLDPLTTRVAWTPGTDRAGDEHWQAGDQIWVMDNSLTFYDKYLYNAETEEFEAKEGDNEVDDPTIALFQYYVGDEDETEGMHDFHWNYDTKKSEVTYTIPADLKWGEESELVADGTMAYLSNMPLWGETSLSNGELNVSLRFLTAIVRADLSNVPGNAKKLIVKAYSDQAGLSPAQISGDFTAALRANKTVDKEAALEKTLEDGAASEGHNTLTIDLTGATFEQTYVFIPLIAREYGLLRYYYEDSEGNEKLIVEQQTVNRKRGTSYKIEKSFEIAGDDIPALNRALELQKNSSSILLETAQNTRITSTEEGAVNELTIPEGIAATDITINLKGLVGGSTAAEKILTIKAAGEYTGKLTINVPGNVDETGKISTSNITDVTNVYINLPKADVVIAGNWTNIDLGKSGSVPVENSLNVKTLSIAANAIVKGIYPNAVSCANNAGGDADIKVAEGDDVNKGVAKVSTLTLKNQTSIKNIAISDKVGTVNAQVTKEDGATQIEVNVVLDGKAAVTTLNTFQKEIAVPAGTSVSTLSSKNNNGAKIEVAGSVTTLNAYNGGSVYVNGDAGKITTLKADNESLSTTDAKEVGYLEVKGKGTVATANVRGAKGVFLARTTSGVAVTTLNMGEGKTLNLQGGYIGTLNGAKDLTFKNTELDGVATAIGTVNDVTLKEGEENYTSTWGGAKASGATYLTTTNDSNNEIWTASQFAAYTGGTNKVVLAANIDMNDKAFTPGANIAADFDGNYKTISRVSINSTKAAGLFLTLATNGSVKNLLINGIGINQTSAGTFAAPIAVGALVATANGGTITNVNVKNATLTNSSWAVGGLVGNVADGVKITGKTAADDFGTDKFSTVAVNIVGKNKLGGLVGQITSGNVTISDYKAEAKFDVKEELANDRKNFKNFGTVAPYVGTALAGSLTVTGTQTSEMSYEDKIEAGFKNNNELDVTVENGASVENNYCFVGHKEIGYVSASNFSLTPVGVNSAVTKLAAAKVDTKAAATTSNKTNVNVFLKDSAYVK